MRAIRWALLLGALLVAAWAGRRAWTDWIEFQRVDAVCAPVAARDWAAVLEGSEHLVDGSPGGRRVVECRCVAWLETGHRDRCVAEMELVLSDPASGQWLPSPMVTAVVVQARRRSGALPEAVQLAHRGAIRFDEHPVLFYLETVGRLQLEDPASVLEEMEHRVARPGLDPARRAVLRLQLANAYLERSSWVRAAAVAGDRPLTADTADRWFRVMTTASAGAGQASDLRELVEAWKAMGDAVEARAYYALLLSKFQLEDPERSHAELLEVSLAERDQLRDPTLVRSTWIRLVGSLATSGDHERALAWYDRGVAELGDLDPIRRDEILRSSMAAELGDEGLFRAVGSLRFELADPRPGDRLRVSPPAEAPVDGEYETISVPSEGVVVVDRALGVAPQRWVLVDDAERVVGSGTVWPVPDQLTTVPVGRVAPTGRPVRPAVRPAGDGRARVVVVLLDGGDWRLVQYLRARDELPTIDLMATHGWRAVLTSEPPFTAAAMQAIVTPERRGVASMPALVYQLGAEIEGLNFVGRNPVAGLRWVLPSGEDLFAVLGAGEHTALNLLKSFGPLDIGRQGEIVGPRGARSVSDPTRASRPLRPDERALLPVDDELHRDLLEEMAADFDAVLAVAEGDEIDVVFARIASFDLLTHGLLPDAVAGGQDDGEALLFGVYRFADLRLGEIDAALDADDLLVVMSDHGIRTAMEHDPRALFVAHGAGAPVGRADDSPDLRGVGRAVADVLGVETSWPDTGVGWLPGASAAVSGTVSETRSER